MATASLRPRDAARGYTADDAPYLAAFRLLLLSLGVPSRITEMMVADCARDMRRLEQSPPQALTEWIDATAVKYHLGDHVADQLKTLAGWILDEGVGVLAQPPLTPAEAADIEQAALQSMAAGDGNYPNNLYLQDALADIYQQQIDQGQPAAQAAYVAAPSTGKSRADRKREIEAAMYIGGKPNPAYFNGPLNSEYREIIAAESAAVEQAPGPALLPGTS